MAEQYTAEQAIELIGDSIEVPTRELIAWQEILGNAVNSGDRLPVARVQIVIQGLLEHEIASAQKPREVLGQEDRSTDTGAVFPG